MKPPKKPIIKKDFKNSLFESFNKKKNIPIKKDPVTFTISVDNGKLELEIKFTVPIWYLSNEPIAPPIAILNTIKLFSFNFFSINNKYIIII